MSDDERVFYKIAKERGESLERAQDVIEDLSDECERLRTALKGFTDVMTKHGLDSSDDLEAALNEWEANIPAGSAVWVIQPEYDCDPDKMRIETREYDPASMRGRLGFRVFRSPGAAARRLGAITLLTVLGKDVSPDE